MVQSTRAIKMRMQTLIEQVEKIEDPRRQYGYLQHKLVTVVVIAFCAIICGAADYEDIEDFGNIRKGWLSKFLAMENGIPDKDTFRRVFERLNPSEVAECLYGWLDARYAKGKTVNIDGKTICGSANAKHKAYHVVSAWVSENQITLGEIVVDEKSNENLYSLVESADFRDDFPPGKEAENAAYVFVN
jgi:hypothetical protein